jgi:glutamate-1-semialdehyde 2,1-aminomutase
MDGLKRNYTGLLEELTADHERRSPRSADIDRTARHHLVDGGSHAIRLLRPFPPRIVSAHGGWITDEDGHRILDFWQGHLANILGHNPEPVTSGLAAAFSAGHGLQSGLVDGLQAEVAELICRTTGAERVRLTTSGTLANMYAVMLSRAFTGRDLVMKVGGGWHGAQPWSLSGLRFRAVGVGFGGVDTAGLPASMTDEVVVSGFNNAQRLTDDFGRYGDRTACLVVEPLIGAGGTIPARREYLEVARELCHRHGALLVFDEVISGFRFHAGSLGALFGVEPDLSVFGKIIGGGMPVAAVAGRADVMGQMSRHHSPRVNISGGTYSAHPASMLAAKIQLEHLVRHEAKIYPRLAELGTAMRTAVEVGFADGGVLARCTGHSSELPNGSSVFMVHFPHRDTVVLDTPEAVFDPTVCDQTLRDEVLGLALLMEDVHLVLAHGAAATAHTLDDMALLETACGRVARRIGKHR